jgi:predicted Fe-Mo cluster-binding NifX family protein
MTIIVPVDSASADANIVKFLTAENFVEIVLDEENKIKTTNLYTTVDHFFDTCDYIVVPGNSEDMSEYLEAGIQILMATPGSDIDDIYESFMFRELHELS